MNTWFFLEIEETKHENHKHGQNSLKSNRKIVETEAK
jgi:hypothetical protein